MPREISSRILCSTGAVHGLSSLYLVGVLIKLMSYVIHAVYLRHTFFSMQKLYNYQFNPLNAELNPTSHLLALLGAHRIFHVSGLRVKVRRKTSKEAIFGRTRIVFFFGGGGGWRGHQ